MPAKRRTDKRRSGRRWNEDLRAWEMVFETGCDFFGELQAATGLVAPHRTALGPEREAATKVWVDTIRDAWGRMGPSFLAQFHGDKDPWALIQFGRPWEFDMNEEGNRS